MSDPPETLGPSTQPGTGVVPRTLPGDDPTLPRARSRTKPASSPPSAPTIGRFLVQRRLGAGAMGVVVLAHDPDLARPVAIKLLRTHGEDAHARLRREAQAVAKIQHPNVIAVHEVGAHEGQVYVVMEYVDGGTLRDWVGVEARSWREVLDVYRQAGLGLIAAHRAGLVHRDFKPDNVLIGRDGRVRVTDFGIVGTSGEAEAPRAIVDANARLDDFAARLTQTGAILGTPAYMPPEQYEAGKSDQRTDQFAFCVSLFEALFGERPYRGDTVGSLLLCVQSGTVCAVPSTDVPVRIVSAVMRGLRPDPAQRHPSMQALLRALQPEVATRSRWPWTLAGVGLVAALVGGTSVALLVDEADDEDAVAEGGRASFECSSAGSSFSSAWDEEDRAAVKAAFEGHGAFQADLFGRVASALDAREQAWTWGVEQACAARKSGTRSPHEYELQRACFDVAREDTRVFVELLSEGARPDVDAAVSMVTMLPRIEVCGDPDALEDRAMPSPVRREDMTQLRRGLNSARSLLLAGKHDETVALARGLATEAQEVGFAPTHAAVLEVLARGEMQTGDYASAEAHARRATELAAASGHPEIETRAYGTSMFVISTAGRPQEARGMLRAGIELFERTRDPRARSYYRAVEAAVLAGNGDVAGAREAADDAIRILETIRPVPADELANAYVGRAALWSAVGSADAARADQERALEVAKEGLGVEHMLYGTVALSLGTSLNNTGNYEDAIELHRAALDAWEASLGRDHPSCALALAHIGNAEIMLQRYDDADASLRDALSRLDASGGDDPNTRLSLVKNLGMLAFSRGEYEAAEGHYAAAADLVRERIGPKDAQLVELTQTVGSMRYGQGDLDGALESFRRAKDTLVEVYGPKQQPVAAAAALVGDALRYLERCDEAAREYKEAFRIYSDLSLPADVTLAQALAGHGVCELELDDLDAAESSLSRAGDLMKSLELQGQPAAMIQFSLAKGRLAVGDRKAADRLSADAAASFEALGAGWTAPHDEVRTWRSKRGF